ncbi:stalk domain-containing protein [Caldisericum sp. AR60]|uniref:stalk domain-containing protein n=1 Tax=Caldisericum sp. AR60 TaxID=3397852 RepID=UPI0039FCB9D2
MKKFLSILLAVTMVFSLVVVARVPTASASIGPLRAPATDTGKPTYTMGELITGTVTTNVAENVYLIDSTSSVVDQYAVSGSGPFVLRTSATTLKEGLYEVAEGNTTYGTSGNVKVYLKYNISNITPASAPTVGSTNVLVSGKVFYGDTSSSPVSGVTIVVAWFDETNNKYIQEASGTTNASGIFSFYATFPNAGKYVLFVSDNYAPDFVNNDPNAGVAHYYEWTVGPSQLVVNLVVQPTLLYSNCSLQNVALYITDTNGAPQGGLSLTATHVAGVSATLGAVTDNGSGFYTLAVKPSNTTIGSETIKLSTSTAVGYVTLNYLQPGDWNPQLYVIPGSNNGFGIDQPVTFTYNETLPTGWFVHYTASQGPTPESPVTLVSSVYKIKTGGKLGYYVKKQLWNSTNPLKTKTKVVEQKFDIYPTITSDIVDITPKTSIPVDSTQEVDVTVKMANGEARNNGKVVLVGPAGMFTVPSGAQYQLAPSYAPGKDAVVLDATGTGPRNNANVEGGVYKFPGLKFNLVGTIDIEVYGEDGTTLTSKFYSAISVKQKVVNLTASVDHFVIGKIYPEVTVSGAVPGLTFTCAPSGIQIADNGDGSYKFNFATPITGGVTISAPSADGKTLYTVTIRAVTPTLKITSVHKDGLITNDFSETVTFDLIDPDTGNVMSHSNDLLAVQWITDKTDLSIYGLPVSSLWNDTVDDYDVVDQSVKDVKASYGNPLVGSKPAMLSIKTTVSGTATVIYTDVLKVTDPSITVTPQDLKLYTEQDNKFAVDFKDAHGKGLEGVAVNVQLPGPYPILTAYTDVNGHAAFKVHPEYEGEGYISVGALQPYTFQIVPAPKDTTPPTLTVTSPADGSTVNTATVEVTGTATDNVGVTFVAVNYKQVSLLPDGSFATEVQLNEGANTIVVKAFDAAGNVATKTIKVTYQKPAPTGTKIVLWIGLKQMTVNDRYVDLDVAPEIHNGRTFVPLRAIAEAFGAQVDFAPLTQGITVVLGNNQIGLQIGNDTAVVNGNVFKIVPPYIDKESQRTMVPLRVIAEAFGAKIDWDPFKQMVTITMP